MIRTIGAVGLLLILAYVRISLIPFILSAALCGALVAMRSRAAAPIPMQPYQGDRP